MLCRRLNDLFDRFRLVALVWHQDIRQLMMYEVTDFPLASKPADYQDSILSIRLYQRTFPASDDP